MPTFIYHFTGRSDYDAACESRTYFGDTLNTEGFIHCSTAEQVARVANSIARGRTDLVLLKIDSDKLVAPVTYENLEGGEQLFPHLYGPLNMDAVIDAMPFEPNEAGEFEPPGK